MFALSFFYVLSSMLLFRGVLSAPACELSLESRSTSSTSLSKRAVPAAPRFVVYSDKFVSGLTGPPPVSEIAVRVTSLYSIRITLIKSSRVSTSCAKPSGFFSVPEPCADTIVYLALCRSCSSRGPRTRRSSGHG